MNWKNSRGEQLVFWRVGSFPDTSGNQTLVALRAKTGQTLVRSLGQSGTSIRTQCQPAIYKESSKYLRPTRDNVTDNRERKAGLPICMQRDEGLEQGSFREVKEGVDQMVYPIEACESSKKHSKRRWSGASHSSSCIR